MQITILLNGKEEKMNEGMAVSDFLRHKDIKPEVVTVEINDNIIERKDFAATIIKDKDRVEFVFFMGGGNAKKLQISNLKFPI